MDRYRTISHKPESIKDDEPMSDYGRFEIKRLTKANSFMILDEQFYIAKKDCDGKSSRLYHVYRVFDMRHICPSTLDKDETIRMVTRKYFELDSL